jgi:hypothetical protein
VGRQQPDTTINQSPQRKKSLWIDFLAVTAAIALAPSTGRGFLQNTYPHLPPELNRIPDGNQTNEINAQHNQNRSFEAANAKRQRQITADCVKLLKLATELRAELDATDKGVLSINMIRKADEIEKLSRAMKEKMQLSVGSS